MVVVTEPPVAPPRKRFWHPLGDPSRSSRLLKVLAWLAGVALVVLVLQLVGVDASGWLSDLWHTLTGIGLGYLVAGWVLPNAQATLPALGLVFILPPAYP